MIYKGTAIDGVVVLPSGTSLPEGAEVEVHRSELPRHGRWIASDHPMPDLTAQQADLTASELASMAAATSELPADLADQHDHYLQRLPKR